MLLGGVALSLVEKQVSEYQSPVPLSRQMTATKRTATSDTSHFDFVGTTIERAAQ